MENIGIIITDYIIKTRFNKWLHINECDGYTDFSGYTYTIYDLIIAPGFTGTYL